MLWEYLEDKKQINWVFSKNFAINMHMLTFLKCDMFDLEILC
jgi:hypothetical protein